MEIANQVAKVVEVARSWKGTAYHPTAAIKQVGVSCAHFIAETFNEAIGTRLTERTYSTQWFVNEAKEIYLEGLLEQGFVVTKEQNSGNIVLSKTQYKVYCHAGIIDTWPSIMHITSSKGWEQVKTAYASWYFGQRPDSLLFLTRKEWNG
jgi:hypothetical protein